MQIEVSHLVKEYKRKRDPGSMVKALASMFHPDYERFRENPPLLRCFLAF